jgi:hypothetical protein
MMHTFGDSRSGLHLNVKRRPVAPLILPNPSRAEPHAAEVSHSAPQTHRGLCCPEEVLRLKREEVVVAQGG